MIPSREQAVKVERPTELVPVPELGAGFEFLVQGFSVADIALIKDASGLVSGNYSARDDVLWSLIKAIKEPEFKLEDAEKMLQWPAIVSDRIIEAARRLGGNTDSAYAALKDNLRQNPYWRRIYRLCVEKLGRLPSELTEVSEQEFLEALAAEELDAEDELEAREV